MAVSYATSTYKKAQQFNQKLSELQETIDPKTIRTYLANASRAKREDVEIPGLDDLSEDDISALEELRTLRTSAIQGEMKYAIAQAEKSGINLPESIVSGETIVPGFSQKVLNKVPSLGVYQLFMLFTEKELDSYLEQYEPEEPKSKPTQDNGQR